MQIKLNSNLDPLPNASQARPKAAAGAAAGDAVSLEGAEHIAQVFATSPDARAEAVASARQLIAQSSYPPPETIDKIAALLAANFEL